MVRIGQERLGIAENLSGGEEAWIVAPVVEAIRLLVALEVAREQRGIVGFKLSEAALARSRRRMSINARVRPHRTRLKVGLGAPSDRTVDVFHFCFVFRFEYRRLLEHERQNVGPSCVPLRSRRSICPHKAGSRLSAKERRDP